MYSVRYEIIPSTIQIYIIVQMYDYHYRTKINHTETNNVVRRETLL